MMIASAAASSDSADARLSSSPDASRTRMASRASRLTDWGTVPCDPAGMVVVRAALGASVAWFAFETLASTSLVADYIAPPMHLTYLGFDWVRPWPGVGMHVHFLVMLAAAVGVAVGLFYRASALLMLLTFAHAFLIERSIYNNHYYLQLLLALLANVIPLHCQWSVDAWRCPAIFRPSLPRWTLSLLRFQVGIVYFFGGIAKLNSDWLRGQPMRMWLKAQTDYPVIGSLFTEEWVVQLFVWSGLLIDLLAVPGLLWRRTRVAMFAVLTLFHLLNSTLFTIGVFPWLMIALTTIFLTPDWPRRLIRRSVPTSEPRAATKAEWTARRRFGAVLLAIYVLAQLAIPLRHFLSSGNPSWTEHGQLFAWRMMLRQKRSGIRLFVTDPRTGRRGVVDVRAHLTPRQVVAMSRDPDLIVQFAHKLADLLRQHGFPHVEIRADALASLNGRQPQHLIDPNVDLVTVQRSLREYKWVVPLTEEYRHDDWEPTMGSVAATPLPGAE
ncbi:MAG: HTTM domain-containing protein [Planctomycetaceae bacterium]|nr:HTTM domain-containing protein [Planctomycetaceae bacterium]